ncbi:MAG: hypothetical protein AAF514_22020, partial [Verrucomicrobiota bacterium]
PTELMARPLSFRIWRLGILALALTFSKSYAQVAKPFLADLQAHLKKAETVDSAHAEGKDGWFFYTRELRAMSVGPFWGKDATGVSRASNTAYADPLAPILDFHRQLEKAGIHLLLVPVPAKAMIYGEKLSAQAPPTASFPPVYLQFFQQLEAENLPVLDLTDRFSQAKTEGPVFCKTDTHWSGSAVRLAATAISEKITAEGWLTPGTNDFRSSEKKISIHGDLMEMSGKNLKESLTVHAVSVPRTGKPIPIDRKSPLLLMGDSHTLVFHDPGLHASGAGLPDHLALTLKQPVDLIGVRGSGATATRMSLVRRRDNLAGKKVVVWCFTMREFTESSTGWRTLPVIR